MRILKLLLFMGLIVMMVACGGGGGGSSSSGDSGGSDDGDDDGDDNGGGGNVPTTTASYVVFAWNDLGMHCLNPTYDSAVILPPYNNLYTQVVLRGNPPQVITNSVTVQYRILNNTYSYGKTSTSTGGIYAQFWDNVLALFGVTLAHDTGLNLDDPTVNNGLAGYMLAKADHFVANGIPVTPVKDDGTWDPYQVAEVTVKDANGVTLATTQATIPTSDEISCSVCHGAVNTFDDILTRHDSLHGTTLMASKPVLCASCHGDPVLGQTTSGTAGYLSYVIHNAHASRGATCYNCHPGAVTQCNRSIAHTASDGNCTTCHGTMATMANSIASGAKTPWLTEPNCADCHIATISGVDTGTALYRVSTGHGGLYCIACHGSPHAMVPSSKASDNYQALQYQGVAKTIADCGVCHATSRGGGSPSEFAETHGRTGGESETSACNICHTGFSAPADTSKWPHAFQWQSR